MALCSEPHKPCYYRKAWMVWVRAVSHLHCPHSSPPSQTRGDGPSWVHIGHFFSLPPFGVT